MGPILWQFPPNFGWNEQRFREFFELLPRDTAAAEKLARAHDDKVKVPAAPQTDATRPPRYAVEIRRPSFLVPEFFSLLRRHNIAFAFPIRPANGPTSRKSPPILFIAGSRLQTVIRQRLHPCGN
ncbi:MAG: DUF72 domain-containing protein [Chthoniobacterales bacterium]